MHERNGQQQGGTPRTYPVLALEMSFVDDFGTDGITHADHIV